MRIMGYVVLVLGILFALLFGLAELGGAHLGIVPFYVSFILVMIGAGLARSGKGIVRAKPTPTAQHAGAQTAPAQGQPVAPAREFATVELPLTPEVAAVIADQSARKKRILLYIVGGFLGLFVGLGVVIDVTDNTPGEGLTFLLAFGGIGVVTAVLIYGISWLTTLKPVRRDLGGTTYLRTTGPVSVQAMGAGGMLRLADRAFLMNGRGGMKELSILSWAIVDYSPHGHVILAAWDSQGRRVYCLPGYDAGSGDAGR
jgi:hypothetical protein